MIVDKGKLLHYITEYIEEEPSLVDFTDNHKEEYAILVKCVIEAINDAKQEFPTFDSVKDIISGNAKAEVWFKDWLCDSS